MLAHQLERLRRVRAVDALVVATTTAPHDEPILALAAEMGFAAYAGSENDVLDRYYRAAVENRADVVVRLTADCPLIDPTIVDRCVQHYLDRRDQLAYVSTGPTFADGQDVEVIAFPALEEAWRDAAFAYEREHVTPFIWQSGRFAFERLVSDRDLSAMRWTVDEEADLAFVTAIYEKLYPRCGYDFTSEQVLEVLARQPELMALNGAIGRNEGFLKSLRAERVARVRPRPGGIAASEALWARAKGLIPAGTQTLSKGPSQYVDGVAPKYLARASGSHVWDVDGNEYIDYPMGLGAVLLGHNYPATSAAIQQQLEQGYSFTLMHPLEVEVAERLRALVPCAEMVRFGKNGSDATTGAIRVARAYTGREKVAHCGYHGWHDWYVGSTTRNRGVPRAAIEQQFPFGFNDLTSLERIFAEHPGEIAAVIMEPYGATLPAAGFLENVRDLTHRNGAVLIFDEVASGFRFHVGGIHQYFGVDPDIACFGKAMANGMPLSAIVGRAEVMQVLEEVFYSFTFGGDCLALASAKATLHELETKPVIQHIWEQGSRLSEGLNRLIFDLDLQRIMECVGLAPRTFLVIRDHEGTPSLVMKSLLQQEMVKRGVLAVSAGNCISFSHSLDDIEYTLGAYQEALEYLSDSIRQNRVLERLEGCPIQPVFRPTT